MDPAAKTINKSSFVTEPTQPAVQPVNSPHITTSGPVAPYPSNPSGETKINTGTASPVTDEAGVNSQLPSKPAVSGSDNQLPIESPVTGPGSVNTESNDPIPSNAPLDIPIAPVSVVSEAAAATKVAANPVPLVLSDPPAVDNEPAPPSPPASNITVSPSGPVGGKSKKIPVLVAVLFIIVVIAGFSGSFLIYMITRKPEVNKRTASLPPQPVPTVTTQPASNAVNPFITPTISFRNLFSGVAQAYDNPFSDQNPFTGVSTDNQPYQNPFESLK